MSEKDLSYHDRVPEYIFLSQPGIFWAGYASSGVVEALDDYWAYFEPIRQYMPKNCSADVEAVIAHVDKVFMSGDDTAITALKSNWGMGSVKHLDDVAGALRCVIQSSSTNKKFDLTQGFYQFLFYCHITTNYNESE